jgi:hypothetical protein
LSNAADDASGKQWPQVADNSFHLGQFWHEEFTAEDAGNAM